MTFVRVPVRAPVSPLGDAGASSVGWLVAGGLALAGIVGLGIVLAESKPRRRVEIYQGRGKRRYITV